MRFLSPWVAVMAAAVAIPLLLLLYFLKLRRRPVRVASSLLWEKSFRDLQVNTPFQRLRWSLLLLLQLILLVILLVALAEPLLDVEAGAAPRVIVLIDRSASMNAVDVAPAEDGTARTRLDEARRAAREIVDRLGRGGGSAREAMIVTFGSSAQIVTTWEANRGVLREVIDSIGPTDEQADLEAALKLADGFAATRDETAERPPDIVLISDGGVAPALEAAGFSSGAGSFRYVRVGPDPTATPANLGIVSVNARRAYDDPTEAVVFARLANSGTSDIETTVNLLRDEEPVASRRLVVPARTEPDGPPGEATLTFTQAAPDGAVLAVRHTYEDALTADDVAAVVLPPPVRPRLALVYGDEEPDPFLRDLLDAFEPQSIRQISAEAWRQWEPERVDSGAVFDLVVFDRVAPQRLPGIPTITFGAAPESVETVPPSNEDGRPILSWKRQHPVMRHVSLDPVVYSGFGAMKLPAGGEALATGPEGAVIALLSARGARHVVVGFELWRSNWLLHVSIGVFLQNVFDHLMLARTGRQGLVSRAGEAVSVRVPPGVTELRITGPVSSMVPVSGGQAVALPGLRLAGLYTVEGAAPPGDRVAVGVLSEVESDLVVRDALRVNAEEVSASGVAQAAPLELWPWVTAAAFILVLVEWLVYCRQIRR